MTKINIDFDEHKSLRKVLSKFSTGVTVVTCIDKKNNPVGITVNSFSSVSLEPALISWCLGRSQPSYKEFINSEGFVVNILSKSQMDICKRFSNPCINKFKDFDYKKTDQGYPVIINSLATIICKSWAIYPGGDHDILVGEVTKFNSSKDEPLIFWNGSLS